MNRSGPEYIRYLQIIFKLWRFAKGEGPPLTHDEVVEFWRLHKKFGGTSPFSRHLEITMEKVIAYNEELILEAAAKQQAFEDEEDEKNLKAIKETLDDEKKRIGQERAKQAQKRRSKDDDRGR